ncbi:phage tail sheath subtilisin-like domain-containing protein [uncultured Rikenella sp.]|uniref:phage tail sheath family protein n=1 Tax=uncultured Rikenella sp. TaxID=368003 RepID=UPI0026017CED|nr:phage tail sheath subtilisin-like domain-containing protein [uncultured Rikenella sp.]
MTYLHGIKIKEGAKNALLAAGDTSVIALVGTAPLGAVGTLKLITSAEAAVAEYGTDISGFTIPAALETIFTTVAAKVLVVNVLSAEKATALLESDGKMTRDETNTVATNIYKSTLPEAVDYTTELLAGLDLLLTADDTLGVKPNIIITPGYSQIETVMTRMLTVADKLDGFAIIDMVAEDVQDALTARASGIYNITSQAAVLCYPQVLRHNTHEATIDKLGLSVHWAAAKATRDGAEGYWLSPSNSDLTGIVGLTTSITSSLTDETADTNLLNAQGITTVFRKSGMGTRLWGNWTAAYPSQKTSDCMIAPRAVRMAIREALVDASLNYMDKAATGITVDMITSDVNAFLRNLIGQGAIVEGECTWDEAKNPAIEIAQGKLTFTLSVQYSPSLECLTFEEVVEL